jgi:anti-sigma-K factor RskA
MDERLTPDERRDLLGAFALGALDDTERAEVEQYVLDDTDARVELHQLEHAVAWLGHASPRPSAASWEAVRSEIARDVAAADAPATDDAPVMETNGVVSLEEVRSRRAIGGWRRLTAVAAAVLIVVGSAIAVGNIIDHDSTTPTRTIALRAAGGRTTVARIGRDGTGTITTTNLPPAPAGHVYQLWAQTDPKASMRSAGIVGASLAGHHIRVPADTVRIAISVEPDGGSPAPTTDPVGISAVGAL